MRAAEFALAVAALLAAGPAFGQARAPILGPSKAAISQYLTEAVLNDPNGNPTPVRRWDGPIHVVLNSDSDDVAFYRDVLQRVLERLAPLAGLSFSFGVASGARQRGDLLVEFADRDLRGELMSPNAICMTNTRSEFSRITQATLTISTRRRGGGGALDADLVEDCIQHELMHALGFGHTEAIPSIMHVSRNNSASTFTILDAVALYALYDSRLVVTSRGTEVASIIELLADELAGADVRAINTFANGFAWLQAGNGTNALNNWLIAAGQGLARAYRDGIGGFQSDRDALFWFTVAAEHGMPFAQFNLAELVRAHEPTRAAALYRGAAEQGVREAAERLAAMFAAGDGVAADVAEAARWDTAVGMAYWTGRGSPYGVIEARAAFERGAAGGNPTAMISLATLEARGHGGVLDAVSAVSLYERARAQTSEAEWAEVCESQRCANLAYEIALAYGNGRGGLPRDAAQTLAWLDRAASEGQMFAAVTLAGILLDGRIAKSAPDTAAALLRWALISSDAAVRRSVDTLCKRVECAADVREALAPAAP